MLVPPPTVATAAAAVSQANRTTADTTVEDVYRAYPDMEAEVEGELKAEKWG